MNIINHKVSRYNFVLPYKGEGDGNKRVLYNSRTNALALIDEEKYAMYKDFKESGQSILDEKLLSDLERGGYILRDDIDEFELIRFNLLQGRYNTSSLGLTIAPTSDCNFRCIYCYEKDSIRSVTMSDNVQDKIVEFVEARANSIMHLNVTWYGGEPLLAMGIIESLTTRFLEICDKNKIEYGAGVVTNGYFLIPEYVEKFKSFKISTIQVTLDGTPEEHDKRRPLAGGQPTFNRIISNLQTVKDILPCPVNIRINTDKHNVDQVDRVLEILEQHDLKNITRPYLGMVETPNDCYAESTCFHPQEFSIINFNYTIKHRDNIANSYPHLVANACGADANNSLVINADGKLYKCWNDIGVENMSVGDLLNLSADSQTNETAVMLKYLMYDPTQDKECSKCNYLPLCMGGCPNRRLFRSNIRCNIMKYRLNDYLELIAPYLKQQKDNDANEVNG